MPWHKSRARRTRTCTLPNRRHGRHESQLRRWADPRAPLRAGAPDRRLLSTRSGRNRRGRDRSPSLPASGPTCRSRRSAGSPPHAWTGPSRTSNATSTIRRTQWTQRPFGLTRSINRLLVTSLTRVARKTTVRRAPDRVPRGARRSARGTALSYDGTQVGPPTEEVSGLAGPDRSQSRYCPRRWWPSAGACPAALMCCRAVPLHGRTRRRI